MPITLMTEFEACKTMSLSRKSLQRARSNGRLPFIKVGRSIRYTIDDIETFISEARVTNCNHAAASAEPIRKQVSNPPTNGIISFTARRNITA